MQNIRTLYQWRWRPRIRRGIYELLVTLFRTVSKLIPRFTQMVFKSSVSPTAEMDYRKCQIHIYTDSWVEYDKRAHSCAKEPETISWIENYIHANEVVYDIGANVGAYSLIMGKIFTGNIRVYAFEPAFANYAQLCRNIALNGLQNSLHPFMVALSNNNKIENFNYSSLESGTALHSIDARDLKGQAVCQLPVLSYSLDDFVIRYKLPLPNHIKLDVDGVEYEILQGASKILSSPFLRSLIVESEDDRRGSEKIQEILHSFGLSLHHEHVHDQNPYHPGPYVKNSIYTRKS